MRPPRSPRRRTSQDGPTLPLLDPPRAPSPGASPRSVSDASRLPRGSAQATAGRPASSGNADQERDDVRSELGYTGGRTRRAPRPPRVTASEWRAATAGYKR